MDGNKKLFDIDGIHMLGNFDNGAVIGLDDEGYAYVETADSKLCDEIKKILDGLKHVGVQKIVISGGEPFIRNDLEEICRYAKEVCGFEFLTIITNGTMDYEVYERV